MNTNTSNGLPNIIDETFYQHKTDDKRLAFSLCFGIENGYMTIGGLFSIVFNYK